MSDKSQSTKSSARKSAKKGSSRRVNRSQQQARQVRAAESNIAPPVQPVAVPSIEEYDAYERSQPKRANRRQAVTSALALPRRVEYAYIESDLRRLIITASALLVLMIVLLFLVD